MLSRLRRRLITWSWTGVFSLRTKGDVVLSYPTTIFFFRLYKEKSDREVLLLVGGGLGGSGKSGRV
jgi:hypothetical protein